ncbi:MAG: hypothetical protein AAF078_02020 [Planctomycetota bacterium]
MAPANPHQPPRPTPSRRGFFSSPAPPSTRPPFRARTRRLPLGLSFVEALIAGLALTAIAFGLVVVSRSVQAVDAEERTRSILARLTAAAHAYADAQGPTDWADADAALRAIRSVRAPELDLDLTGVNIRAEPGRGLIAIDGYGRPFRYAPPEPGTPVGQFISAGRDGLFGDEPHLADPLAIQRAAADNHLGDELAVFATTPALTSPDTPAADPTPSADAPPAP